MKLLLQLTMAAAVAAGALALTSCGSGGCCTGEDPVPGLRPLPNFDGPPPVVNYSK